MSYKVNANPEDGKGLYAFCRYDLYPYCLGGEVEEILENGKVRVKGFQGFIFYPLVIVPKSQGVKIKEQLDTLEKEYKKALDELDDKYQGKAKDVAFFL
jgi:hypothetical protein